LLKYGIFLYPAHHSLRIETIYIDAGFVGIFVDVEAHPTKIIETEKLSITKYFTTLTSYRFVKQIVKLGRWPPNSLFNGPGRIFPGTSEDYGRHCPSKTRAYATTKNIFVDIRFNKFGYIRPTKCLLFATPVLYST